MSSSTVKEKTTISSKAKYDQIGDFLGRIFSFNSSLKLYHWHISGKGSYAQHTAIDQALGDLLDITDRIVETSYAVVGDIDIVIPETKVPGNIVKHAEDFYKYAQGQRKLFSESFTAAIIDDIQETIQQLLYRLKRLQ